MVFICKLYRSIIFWNFWIELAEKHGMDELDSIHDDEAPSKTIVYRWYGEFDRCHILLQGLFEISCCLNYWCCARTDTVRSVCNLSWIDTLWISGTSIYSIFIKYLKDRFYKPLDIDVWKKHFHFSPKFISILVHLLKRSRWEWNNMCTS